MKTILFRLTAGVTLAACGLLWAQDPEPPPKAVPVPEEVPSDPGVAPDSSAPPKAIPIPEENSPVEEERPDEPWEDPEARRHDRSVDRREDRDVPARR